MSILDHGLLPPNIQLQKGENEGSYYSRRLSILESPSSPKLARRMSKLLRDPDVCPLLGKDLQGLAPAMVVTAGVDILRDEGALYVKRLESFGVPVQWNHYGGAYHGILHMPGSDQRAEILRDICDYIERVVVKRQGMFTAEEVSNDTLLEDTILPFGMEESEPDTRIERARYVKMFAGSLFEECGGLIRTDSLGFSTDSY